MRRVTPVDLDAVLDTLHLPLDWEKVPSLSRMRGPDDGGDADSSGSLSSSEPMARWGDRESSMLSRGYAVACCYATPITEYLLI